MLDALAGGKFIYAEALLPPLSISAIQAWWRDTRPVLSSVEKRRNRVSTFHERGPSA